MNETVRQIVERTIRNTEALLSGGQTSWEVARRGALLVIANLCKKHPKCEIEIKKAFESFIIRHDNNDRPPENKFAARIVQLDRPLILADKRRHERTVPTSKTTTMRLSDGREYDVTILNISVSGIGLLTPVRPPFGSEITVGGIRAIVVRHFGDGIAGQFICRFAIDETRDKSERH